jgi:hypothetical protein
MSTDAPTIDRSAVNRELVDRFGRKPEAVAKWSDALAVTVLHSSRRDERIALNRAARMAGEEPHDPPGEPCTAERVAAADAIEEVLDAGDIHQVSNVVSYTVYLLPNARLRKLAEGLAAALREAANGGRGRRGAVPPGVPDGTGDG